MSPYRSKVKAHKGDGGERPVTVPAVKLSQSYAVGIGSEQNDADSRHGLFGTVPQRQGVQL